MFFRVLNRKRLKALSFTAVGAVGGFVVKALFGWNPLSVFSTLFGLHIVLLESVGIALARLEAAPAAAWISGPVVGATLFYGATKFAWVRRGLDLLFPDPPAFVRTNLEGERRRGLWLLNTQARPAPLVGRSEEMAQLEEFAQGGGGLHWLAVVGHSGVGKSRLAIEWLALRKGRGWDIGFISDTPPADWRPRRATALILDQPQTDDSAKTHEIMSALARIGGRHALRVLVLGQTSPSVEPPQDAEAIRLIRSAQLQPAMRLPGLGKDALQAVWRHANDTTPPDALDVDSGGRPRAVLLTAYFPQARDHAEALALWCGTLLPGLQDAPSGADMIAMSASVLRSLALAALAGPLPMEAARTLSADFNRNLLVHFFDDGGDLETTLPSLAPDDLAQEILLRALAFLEPNDREAIIRTALVHAPDRVEQRLNFLWATRPEVGAAISILQGQELDNDDRRLVAHAKVLAALQVAFDIALPKRVQAAHKAAASALTAGPEGEDCLRRLADQRPFDFEIRLSEATAVFNAINRYGQVRRFDVLEDWGIRLNRLVVIPPFDGRSEIRLQEARAIVAAIRAYGEAIVNSHDRYGHFDDLERWGERFDRLNATFSFALNRDVRLEEARATRAAIGYYAYAAVETRRLGNMEASARYFGEVERWAGRLDRILASPAFGQDPAIRLEEAEATGLAVTYYGIARRFDDLERWAGRLDHIVAASRLSQNVDLRKSASSTASSAILRYGQAGRLDDLKQWEMRLDRIISTPPFDQDPGIRLYEAKAAVNAISGYARKGGEGHYFGDLERWGRRFDRLIIPPYDQNPDIRLEEARAAVNAMLGYGSAGRFEDVERWAARLDRVLATSPFDQNPAMRLEEVKAASNTIQLYGQARRIDDVERWEQRLDHIVTTPPFDQDLEIRKFEATASVNAVAAYGEAKRFEGVERWGKRLDRLVAIQSFGLNTDIRFEEVLAARNALNYLPSGTEHEALQRFVWRRRLAQGARQFPLHNLIQECASRYGLSYLQQADQGWPHGRPSGSV